MKHIPVISSNVASIGHDPAASELEVTFKSGETYVYSGVESGLYSALLLTPSVGSFLHKHIKGRYQYRKKESEPLQVAEKKNDLPALYEAPMREIHGHEGSALNNKIKITADARDENGGSHRYFIDVTGGAPESGGMTFDLPQFQNGPLLEAGHNGISDEALIAILIDRLEGFNTGPFRSRYNSLAITKLEEALLWLNKRTTDRQNRGVEGTHKV